MPLALDISNLVKEYKTGIPVVQNLNYSVEEGSFSAFLGANGAGKSTTLGIIGGLVNKTSGSVKVFDIDLDKHPEQVRSLVGFMPQEVNLSHFDTVESILIDNAGYHGIKRSEATIRAHELLRTIGLYDHKDKQSRMLSGGMKRRLMLARALMHRPKLLILDEPTAGVDVEQREIIYDFVEHLRKIEGMTVILTTHYLEEVERFAERVVMIHQGKKTHDLTLKELLSSLDEETYRLEIRSGEIISHPHLTYLRESHAYLARIDASWSLDQALSYLSQNGNILSGVRPEKNRLESLFTHLS